MVKGVVKWFLPFYLFTFLPLLSCSEDSAEEGDFDNWQQKNETAISQWASNTSYRKILTYSKNSTISGSPANEDYIYVEVLESGVGSEPALYTDTVRLAYRGHYIPTVNYPEGYVFDQTYTGEQFDWNTAGTSKSMAGGFIDGFSTALQNMRVGDRWRIRIPYQLGYGANPSSSVSVLGYSNLVFEVAIYDIWHPGETRPDFRSRSQR